MKTLFGDEKADLQRIWVDPRSETPSVLKIAKIAHRLAIEVERCHLLIAELSARLEGGR